MRKNFSICKKKLAPKDKKKIFYVNAKLIFYILAECGECELYYPNSTKDFEKINLEVNATFWIFYTEFF